MQRSVREMVAAAVVVAACAAESSASSLLFHGSGVAAPDLDRVRIEIDDPSNSLPASVDPLRRARRIDRVVPHRLSIHR